MVGLTLLTIGLGKPAAHLPSDNIYILVGLVIGLTLLTIGLGKPATHLSSENTYISRPSGRP